MCLLLLSHFRDDKTGLPAQGTTRKWRGRTQTQVNAAAEPSGKTITELPLGLKALVSAIPPSLFFLIATLLPQRQVVATI